MINKVIISLGNPEKMFLKTRHNIGHIVLGNIINTLNIRNNVLINNNIKTYLYPSTYNMNLSGLFVKKKLIAHNISIENMLILCDNLDNNFLKLKLKKEGSANGHNGIKSIIKECKTDKFSRLLIGIDRPNTKDPNVISDYVLENFNKNNLLSIENSTSDIINIIKNNNFL